MIASALGTADPTTLEDLTEWELGSYWSGRTWSWIRENRPQEWNAYLKCPGRIDFLAETLDRLAARMRRGLETALKACPVRKGSAVVLVSHSDPLKALALSLLGEDLDRLHSLEIPVGSALLLEVCLEGDSISGAEIIEWHPIPKA